VTLSEVIPARKLYADMLFAVSQYAKSLKQYQVVMKSSPNQPNALLGKRLVFTTHIDKRLLTRMIPRMAIQMLVENVIKHGVSRSVEPGELNVVIGYQDSSSRSSSRRSGLPRNV